MQGKNKGYSTQRHQLAPNYTAAECGRRREQGAHELRSELTLNCITSAFNAKFRFCACSSHGREALLFTFKPYSESHLCDDLVLLPLGFNRAVFVPLGYLVTSGDISHLLLKHGDWHQWEESCCHQVPCSHGTAPNNRGILALNGENTKARML